MMTRLVLLGLVLLIGGCAAAPGMKMSPGSVEPKVEIIPITPELIAKQERARLEGVPSRLEIVGGEGDEGEYEYHIGPRDILSITVWDHPELTIPAGQFRAAETEGHRVAADGTIFYPYAGKVHVAGKTQAEVRELLTEKLSRQIANPQLDVKVVAFRSQKVYVVGEVANPGFQPITDVPLTVIDAIARAGGVTEQGDQTHVILTRGGSKYTINLLDITQRGEVSRNILLKDGDILSVSNRNRRKIFVLGEVTNPSSIYIPRGYMSLSEAISDAGGVNPRTSNPARIFVIRGTAERPEIYQLNAKNPAALVLGDQFQLQPRDVIYVATAGVTRWNRLIENLLPTASLLWDITNINTNINYRNF